MTTFDHQRYQEDLYLRIISSILNPFLTGGGAAGVVEGVVLALEAIEAEEEGKLDEVRVEELVGEGVGC